MDFPMAHCADPICGKPLPPSHAMVPFSLHNKQTQAYLLLTVWTITSVITPTSAQHRLALRTPADSLAVAAHANVQAGQAPAYNAW